MGLTAVHAGILAVDKTGIVKVTFLPGQESYEGSIQNEVASVFWGSWDGGFQFVIEK